MNTQKTSRLIPFAAAISGLLFGTGLTVSEMVNPARVLGFLDLAGNWDPTLVFVMAGAVIISTIGYRIALKMHKPVFGDHFALPTNTTIDRQLLGGAAIFGIGWGLVGLCPGPAIAGLSTLDPRIIGFTVAMVIGFLSQNVLFNKA